MLNPKIKKLTATILCLFGLLGITLGFYFVYASPTRIALVNYPEYILAPMLAQEFNPALDIQHLAWDENSGEELKDFDCVIFFGMGLNFTEKQQEILARLTIPVYTTAATRQETSLAILTDEQRQKIEQYFAEGGKKNFRYLMDYIRYELDGKRIFAPIPQEPEKVISKPFFHIAEQDAFASVEEYFEFYNTTGRYRSGEPTICILGGNGGGSLDQLLEGLEKKNCNVIAINGLWPGNETMEKINPDLIIYQPHGRLGDEAVSFLTEKNIPLFCPIKVTQSYEEYLKDQQGMTGGLLSQSITMPELDGGTTPFVLSALFRNERGLLEFRMIPDRLERFTGLVRKTADLRRKPNADKKIALIYYGSIGSEAATAGLGTAQSVLNILKHLQGQGYNTGKLPESIEALDREIKANTAIFGQLDGQQQSAPEHIQKVIITPEEYALWIEKSMPQELYDQVTQRYGEFPGALFRTDEGNMAIGCIRFGNIVLMPQSLPGEGENESKLIHGAKMAPPHTYIATYLYLQHGFKADALMHVGTHGSLEFTPWKQVALSSFDWPDVLIGSLPHYYFYIINNIGEAQIAKRRSYATMISHLTPPFMNSEAYGPVAALLEKLHLFEISDNAQLKAEYGKSIIELAKQENYHRDLKLSPQLEQGILSEEDAQALQEYCHEISDAKVNRGVYIAGEPYSEAELVETAELMSVDSIAQYFFDQDLHAGKVTDSQRQDKAFFRNHYLNPAHEFARKVLSDPEAFRKKTPPATIPADHKEKSQVPDETLQKMLQSGKLPDGRPIPPAMATAMKQQMSSAPEVQNPEPPLSPEEILLEAYDNLKRSTAAELAAIVNAFSGGYLPATSGGDPILNPSAVPTGKNLYGIDPDRTPTRESFEIGKQLAEALIAEKLKTSGEYPKRVGFSLWGGEFIRTQGVNIAQIFCLLGVEPIWDSRGKVRDIRLIPLDELKRPRIDVIVQTSGQFRGAATSRMKLIDRAVMLAASDPEGSFGNYVREGSLAAVKALIAKGMSPEEAKNLSHGRIFGGVNGNFGTGVMDMAQNTGSWKDTKDIAELYINNMGAIYTEGHWGEHHPELFRSAMANTDTVIQSRSSNSWGPLSLDHVYEFTGGMSLAARHISGKDPEAFFNDLRTPGQAKIQSAAEAAMVEAHSTVLNPKFIKEMMADGAASTGHFTEVFQNTLGWEIMKPDLLEDHLWQNYKEVYVDDKLNLNLRQFFEETNPAALHQMTGIMLEAVRKEFYQADPETICDIARTHVELMKNFDLPPMDNVKLQEMIKQYLDDPQLRQSFENQIQKSLDLQKLKAQKIKQAAENVSGMKLKAQNPDESPIGDVVPALKILAAIIAIGLTAIILGNVLKRKRHL